MKATIVVPLLAVGVLSFVLARSQQGYGGALVVQQRDTQPLTAALVDKAVRGAPDPVSGEKASSATCVPLGRGELRNPWRCVLRYPTGRQFRYQITLNVNGSYTGNHELVLLPSPRHPDTGSIRGCCVAIP